MKKDIAVIAIHGMGDTKRSFADDLKTGLRNAIGNSNWNRVHFDKIYYQDILQVNQKRIFNNMRKKEIDYLKLRKYLLYGFSDAAALERRASVGNSPYRQAQMRIRETINNSAQKLAHLKKPVILVAHSLGGQVISNYLWDSQSARANQGVWKDKSPESTPEDRFLRLKTLKSLYTTGCNIPIFVAGFADNQIKAVKTSTGGYHFKWHNYYDEDDVLGWPLKPLSTSYNNAIHKDYEINADGGFFGRITTAWNPLSHSNYWKDDDFIRPLGKDIMDTLDK